MDSYVMKGGEVEKDDMVIFATVPAAAGTRIVYVYSDGDTQFTDVIAWGFLEDASAVPITLSGPWDGTTNNNKCVQHPSGFCQLNEEDWPSLALAIETLRTRVRT